MGDNLLDQRAISPGRVSDKYPNLVRSQGGPKAKILVQASNRRRKLATTQSITEFEAGRGNKLSHLHVFRHTQPAPTGIFTPSPDLGPRLCEKILGGGNEDIGTGL